MYFLKRNSEYFIRKERNKGVENELRTEQRKITVERNRSLKRRNEMWACLNSGREIKEQHLPDGSRVP
jgi:hypothetical protein